VNLTGHNPNNNFETDVVAIIPARFASTRLPGKALAEIAGKPMICRVAERAIAARNVNRVIVATDSQEIFDVVVGAGFEAAITRADHSSGTDRIAEIADQIADAQVVVNIQGDEPLIAPETIERAVDQMFIEIEASSPVGIVTTWEPVRSAAELLDSAVVKLVVGDDDIALYFSRSPMPFPRDAAVKYGDPGLALETEPHLLRHFRKHTGLYVYRRNVLLQFPKWPQTRLEKLECLEQLRALEYGVKIRVVEASCPSIAVDTPDDLERVRALVAEGKFGFAN
jgi:3-deoxy-manno-octulosonate cytidylyltransferase (CMP-KDO synthetase)